MRRLAVCIFILALLLSGCAFWMTGERLSITPYGVHPSQQGKEVTDVTSYDQLRNALREMVEAGMEEGVVSASKFNETTLDYYVGTAVNYITDSTAIGAYAVDSIDYEIGTNKGISVVAFRIAYRHDKAEIKRLKRVGNMSEVTEAVNLALNSCEQMVTLIVDKYESLDFTKYIDEYANNHPEQVMETPYVSVVTFPANGEQRVVQITLTYLTEKEKLLDMQRQVQAVFTSAELYVKETQKTLDIYSQLYSFLVERSEYTMETSQTPAYSLLHTGIGDCRAFANVYSAMCKRSGLDCEVVAGLRNGEIWYWNVLQYENQLYHIDLLRCGENNRFAITLGKDMEGYEWDVATFPIE